MDIPISGWLLLPFVLMLLTIAVAPLVAEHWWESNRNKLIVSLVLGVPTAIILCRMGLSHNLEHQLVFDYIPFIVLLLGLFTTTGGIKLSGDIRATPAVNTLFLAIGAVLASFMGTTGASMLLIRPVLATNRQRRFTVHTVLFFIAIVSNAGGILTPLGDPPLFLLYLRGAPFTWFFHLIPEWLTVNVLLLVLYYIFDRVQYRKEAKANLPKDAAERQPLRLTGCINFVWLLGVILAVAFMNEQYFPFMKDPVTGANTYWMFLREGMILLMVIASLLTTKKSVREANQFTWGPVVEVAFLFVGIFTTMVPALLYLQQHAQALGLTKPIHFFFATGALSGFLDNAPTALAFHSLAMGLPINVPEIAGITVPLLKAISLGAVLFGSMTYIGNGPNFMVKAIAESSGIKMPDFFKYMYKFSLIILLPIFALVAVIFLL